MHYSQFFEIIFFHKIGVHSSILTGKTTAIRSLTPDTYSLESLFSSLSDVGFGSNFSLSHDSSVCEVQTFAKTISFYLKLTPNTRGCRNHIGSLHSKLFLTSS